MVGVNLYGHTPPIISSSALGAARTGRECRCRAPRPNASRGAPSSPATSSAASTAARQKHLTVDHVVPRSKGGADSWGQRRHVVAPPATCARANRLLPADGLRLAASHGRPSPFSFVFHGGRPHPRLVAALPLLGRPRPPERPSRTVRTQSSGLVPGPSRPHPARTGALIERRRGGVRSRRTPPLRRPAGRGGRPPP